MVQTGGCLLLLCSYRAGAYLRSAANVANIYEFKKLFNEKNHRREFSAVIFYVYRSVYYIIPPSS